MTIKDDDLQYLDGSSYLNTFDFKLNIGDEDYRFISKIDYLEQLVQDKKIMHVGCVDHNMESIEKKIKKNKWLHAILDKSSKECLGIDIKEDEIKAIREKFNFDVHALDITTKHDVITSRNFDYLLLPDVLEHIGNPVEFIAKVRENYKENIDKLVITVPNGFNHKTFKQAANNIEVINTDHRFWFTPYTIAKVLFDAGFEIEEVLTYDKASKEKQPLVKKLKSTSLYRFFRKLLFNETLFTKSGIIVIAKFNK